jgi:alpha-L-arabinofuranosidase
VRGAIETGRTYDLRVECRSGRIKAFVDGAPVLEQSDVGPPTFAGQAGRAQNGDVVLFAVNGSEQPRRLPVVLRGAGALANVATGEVLTSGSLRDENPLEAPAKVAPRSLRATLELRRDGVDTTFEFEFAARSLTVLRLRPAD